ncbi:Bgt-20985 [Blumeria graminis f. sp. tritici]|uniref:Bgt-20985 n=2 Tax=Blumeria graminis f. sp. tritici TaxID=62690 RepID=A0A9X9L7I8_BLUGR|nr:Bgt-20985 [Blumeria graminis f. sp. tritici]
MQAHDNTNTRRRAKISMHKSESKMQILKVEEITPVMDVVSQEVPNDGEFYKSSYAHAETSITRMHANI